MIPLKNPRATRVSIMNEDLFKSTSSSALVVFVSYIFLVFVLAWLAQRVRAGKEFANEYFLGSRNLGIWAFALTFAATNASGGSFMGFPSLIYVHGWVLALWIASYMAVPLVTTGLLAKRLNLVARKTQAITIPELLGARFKNPRVAMVSTCILTFFMFFYLLAQFKAGSHILVILLEDTSVFQLGVEWVSHWKRDLVYIGNVEPDYLLCLGIFAFSVVAYTVYGGFRAVVWTDVLQGIVMLLGVCVMLILALSLTGGLGKATRELASQLPPEHASISFQTNERWEEPLRISKGSWLKQEMDGEETLWIRLKERVEIGSMENAEDVFGVLIVKSITQENRIQVETLPDSVQFTLSNREKYKSGADTPGSYIRPPGPHPSQEGGFLSIGMAFSFFVFWAFGGAGQPSNMVRQMAFKSARTLRMSIMMVAVYYSAIYFPLVIVFSCARVLLPGMEFDPDRVMPSMANYLSYASGHPWLAGLIMAAPFAAVMSSVDSFLLMVSSGLVRDVYQKFWNPNASEATIKKWCYWVTALVGLAAFVAVMKPPMYLQHLIVFASGGLAGSFLMPMALALYWRRMNAAGTLAGIIGGFATHLSLYIFGYLTLGEFAVVPILGLQPFVWDILGSGVVSVAVVLNTLPPENEIVETFFGSDD